MPWRKLGEPWRGLGRSVGAPVGGAVDYKTKILGLFGSANIQTLPLDETSGTNANDISPQNNDGTYFSVDLANADAPSGIGGKCPYMDGGNEYVTAYSAGLASDFNGAEGSLFVWMKVENAGVWTDGRFHRVALFKHNASGQGVGIFKQNTNNTIRFFRTDSVGTKTRDTTIIGGNTAWNLVVLTWSVSNNRLRGYVNNAQVGADVTSLAAITQTIDQGGIGGIDNSNLEWQGWLSYSTLLNREATLPEIQAIYAKGIG